MVHTIGKSVKNWSRNNFSQRISPENHGEIRRSLFGAGAGGRTEGVGFGGASRYG